MKHGNGFKDETGNVYGFWTVKEIASIKRSNASWLCVCICGTVKVVVSSRLRSGRSKSCGCQKSLLIKENKAKKYKNGERFGRLVIKSKGSYSEAGKEQYYVNCDCGNEVLMLRSSIVGRGNNQSCGCLKIELRKEKLKRKLKLQEEKYNKKKLNIMMKDETGKRYGRLVVLERTGLISGSTHWLCLCDCGNKKIIHGTSLRYGYTTTCGCKVQSSTAALDHLFGRYIKNAKSRNIIFNLSKNDFIKLTLENCIYCDMSPSNIVRAERSYSKETFGGTYVYNGVDRKDNSKGYFIENCVSCCELCNKWKSKYSMDFFISHAKKIAEKNI